MASVTDSAKNDESDLVLNWSGRWTLSYRNLAVTILTIVLIALAVIYLDAYRNRLEKERLRQVSEAAGLAAVAITAVPQGKREPLLAALPAWPRAERSSLGALLRAKGGTGEREFARRATECPRFYRELAGVLSGTVRPKGHAAP